MWKCIARSRREVENRGNPIQIGIEGIKKAKESSHDTCGTGSNKSFI